MEYQQLFHHDRRIDMEFSLSAALSQLGLKDMDKVIVVSNFNIYFCFALYRYGFRYPILYSPLMVGMYLIKVTF